MISLRQSLSVAALVVAATFASIPSAQACKCMMPTPEQARDNAAAVFEGHVTAIEKEGGEGASGIGRNVVTLSIVRTWKGLTNEETVKVSTADSTAACGIFFETGKSFLVYAAQGEKGLEAGSCGRTRPMEGAEEDLAALGGGVTPVKVEPKTEAPAAEPAKPPATRGSSCAYSSSSKSAGLLLSLPAVGLVVSRRRRRR